jgi:hypothetical protein
MPIGRPRIPGTDEERAQARRVKVRANVQAFRRRQKQKKLAEDVADCAGGVRPDQCLENDFINDQPPIQCLESIPSIPDSAITTFQDTVWAIPLEFGARFVGTTYKEAFVSALQTKYIPSQTALERVPYGPEKRLSICCSTWVSSATIAISKPETQILMGALLAASLAIVGRDRKDENMARQAACMQTRALQSLRHALARYSKGDGSIDPNTLSLTALTCAMSELIANESWENYNRHLMGVGALIFHGGVQELNNVDALEHFYGYRAMQVPFLFMNRQRVFLSNPEWIDFSWKTDHAMAQYPLNTMLDIAFKALPEILEQDAPKGWTLGVLEGRLERAKTIVDRLNEWERDLRSQHHGVLFVKQRSEWGDPYEHCLDFPLLSLGIAFAMYTAVRIHVAVLIARLSTEIFSRDANTNILPGSAVLEALRWSRLACQCLEFFHSGNAKFAGRIVTLWPLDTAWEFFSQVQMEAGIDASRELAWCRSTAARLASRGIPPFKWR